LVLDAERICAPLVSGMKEVKDLSLKELDQLFRAATRAAREEAFARELPLVGFDKDGKLFRSDNDRTTLLNSDVDAGPTNFRSNHKIA
jgi:hypothetical protein